MKAQHQRLLAACIRKAAFPLLLIAAGTLVYVNSFEGKFFYDDFAGIVENPYLAKLWPPWEALRAPSNAPLIGRPLLAYSLALSYARGGLDPWTYHLDNLIFHLLCALVLFGIVRRTLQSERLRGRFGGAAEGLAGAAALIWTVHPLQTASVTYITQRAEILGALFLLLTLHGAIRALESQHPKRWSAAALAACVLGVLAKETAYAAPLLVIAYDWLFVSASPRALLRKRARLYLGLIATWILLAYLVTRGGRSDIVEARSLYVRWPDYFLTEPGVLLHYLKLSLWPFPQSFRYEWPIAKRWVEILPALTALVALGAATCWGVYRRRPWSFLGVWFFLILAPSSSFLVLADAAFEHRMYLPLAAVWVGLVLGAYRLLGGWTERFRWPGAVRPAVGAALVIAAAGVYGQTARRRNALFHGKGALYGDVLASRPGNVEALYEVGNVLHRRGETEEAERYYRKLLRQYPRTRFLWPTHAHAYLNLAVIVAKRNRTAEAEYYLRKALHYDPLLAPAYNNLGYVYFRKGRLDQGLAYLRKALKLDPKLAEAHANLGWALGRQGRYVEALSHLDRARRLKPGLAMARTYFEQTRRAWFRAQARAYTKKGWVRCLQGDLEGGLERLYRALRLVPEEPDARRYVRVVLKKAEEDFMRSKGEQPELLQNLATAHAVSGEYGQAVKIGELARRLARSQGREKLARRLEEKVKLFRSGRSFPAPEGAAVLPADR